MPRKEKKEDPGAPAWMVTFGDMMSLLLCFFVILVSMSEIKQDQRFQKALESIKRAFGYQGGIGQIPGQVQPSNTLKNQLPNLILRKWMLQQGKSADEGIEGENPSVKTIRDGLEFTIGGRVSFDSGKAELLETAKKQLAEFAQQIKGLNTKIRIQGHAATKPHALYVPFKSLDDLAYARACAVKECLIKNGIREERITVESCGDNEPLVSQAYDEKTRAFNRRVSIIVTESLVEQYQGQPAVNNGDMIDG